MTVQETEIVKEIRDKYLGKETTTQKINRLVSLDESVYRSGNIVALTIGIIGMLIFGFGMSCFLVWQNNVLGIIIGIFFKLNFCKVGFIGFCSCIADIICRLFKAVT